MKKALFVLAGLSLILTFLFPTQTGQAQSQPPTPAEITDYLNAHPRLTETGAQVLSVKFVGEALVIDLSREVLPEGTYDEAVFTDLQSDLDAAFGINRMFLTTFKVEGELLEYWGRPEPDFSDRADYPTDRELPGSGPLAGVKIAISPGHGYYWNESYGMWLLQRGIFNGIGEDTLNVEIMRYLKAALESQGATVIELREFDPNARTGVSGHPAWQEDARQYAIALGLPSWVWDGSNTNYNSDIRSRPYMANYYGADLLISFHNNGWNGELTGTETYWDTDNNPGSQALAIAVHNSIIDKIRSEYDSSWTNRGIKLSDSDYGEINYAQMPAALIELAFMDNLTKDNVYLHDETFKQLSALAIAEGICEFRGVTCADLDTDFPGVVEQPTLTPAYGSGVCDSGWYRYANSRGQYAYLALNAAEEAQSTNVAAWKPELPVNGEYKVEVFIPSHNAITWTCPGLTTTWDTRQAAYSLTHANGESVITVNQAPLSNEWVDLGIFHFNTETVASLTLSDVTGEAFRTTSVSASAVRFTLVGNAGEQFYDTAWVGESWLTEEADATVDQVRNFLKFYRSCLAEPILDADGVSVDLAVEIQAAAAANQIDPKVLLAIMEAEQSAISQCPDMTALANLMGLSPATTARAQVAAAAALLNTARSELDTNGSTPNGWTTGTPKVTVDGVSVTPANDTLAVLFDYSQHAGEIWGGDDPGENGVQGIYIAYRDHFLDISLPGGIFNIFMPVIIR
ncbi:MAG: N-acetylmuramoyl-L-alanine amidase [Anaerolineaceae bacterium]|nr:N-acetylmuramoyl-L-alanine amidase [Anaerolineaceae bacterium]